MSICVMSLSSVFCKRSLLIAGTRESGEERGEVVRDDDKAKVGVNEGLDNFLGQVALSRTLIPKRRSNSAPISI